MYFWDRTGRELKGPDSMFSRCAGIRLGCRLDEADARDLNPRN